MNATAVQRKARLKKFGTQRSAAVLRFRNYVSQVEPHRIRKFASAVKKRKQIPILPSRSWNSYVFIRIELIIDARSHENLIKERRVRELSC